MEEEVDEFGIPIKKEVDEFGIPVKKQVDDLGIPIKKVWDINAVQTTMGAPVGQAPSSDILAAGVGSINRGLSSMISRPLQLLGALNESLSPNRTPEMEQKMFGGPLVNVPLELGNQIEQFTEEINPRIEGVNDTVQDVFEGLGQAGGMVMTGGLSAAPQAITQSATKVPSLLQSTGSSLSQLAQGATKPLGVIGGSMVAVPEWKAAKEAGLSDEEAFQTLLKNYLVGQTEAIPIERLLVGLNKITGGKILETVKLMGQQGITEGVQEGIQTYLTNEIAKSDYDPDRDPLFQVLESAKVGGIVGMILPGAMSVVRTASPEQRVKLERKFGELQADEAINELGGSPEVAAQLDVEAQIDPVDKQVLEEVKVVEAIKQEQKEVEAEEKLQKELEGGTESTENAENTKTNTAEEAEIKPSQTPEYKEAVARVERLQKAFSELSIEENADELLFELREARKSLQQIAGRPASKTSDVKKKIDETTGVAKSEKTVQLTPQQALAAQIKIQDRGIKIGRDLTQDTLIGKIKEAAEEAKLSPKQVKAISNRAQKVTLTPKSIESFNKFVNKVVSDADYSDKLSQARDARKKIRSRKKSDNRSFREKSVMNQFAKINPTEVTDINEYNELAFAIQEGVKGKLNFNLDDVGTRTRELVAKLYTEELQVAPPEGHTVEQMFADLNSKREADRETDRLQKVADDLGITIDEARTLDESEDNTDSRKERLRQSYVEMAKTKKAEPEVEVDKLQAQDITNINKIDPSLLTTDQLKEYIRIVDRINENGDFAMSGRLAAMGKAQEGWRELNSRDMKTLNLTQLEAFMDSQPMAIEAIFGLPKDAALFQLYSGIKGMHSAGALAKREAEIAADFLTNLKKNHPEAFKDESLFRQGMYQELIRTPESMDPDEALRINKELIQSSINKQRAAGFDKEADIDAKYFKPFESATTMDEVHQIMGKIDPSGKKVIDELAKYYENHKIEETGQTVLELIASDNERFENKETERVLNYGGPRSWKNIGRGQVAEMDDVVSFNPEFARAPKPKQVQSGMSLTMRDRDGAILDFNIHKNTIDNIEKSILRAFAKPHQYQMRDFLRRDSDLQKLFGAGATPESVRRANNMIDALFNEQTGIVFTSERDLMNNRRAYPNKFVKNFANFMNGLKKIGYGITLSGWTQLPKQATVLTNVARQLGSDAGLIGDSIREANQEGYQRFFRGETVDIRGEQSAILNVGRFYSASERLEAQNKFNRYMNTAFPLNAEKRFRGKWGGAGVLVATDVNVTKTSFLTFYMKYLKDNGVKYEGVQRELELRSDRVRQEALAYAKQRTDTLQVVSTTAEQSAFFKEQGFLPELARAFFVPYGGFSSNAKTRLFNDYKALAFGSTDQRKQAWKDIQGTALEQASFNVVSQGVKLGMYGAVGMLLRGIFDLEDEEDWSEWWAKTKKQVGKDMIFSNLPVILGSPGEDIMVDFINEMYFEFLKLENPDLTQGEYEKEHAPITRYKGYDDKWWDYLGPYGAPMAKLAESFKLYEQADKEELSREQQTLALVAMLSQLAQFKGILPADIANAVRGEFNKQKAGAKESGKNSGGPVRLRPRPRPRPRPARIMQ